MSDTPLVNAALEVSGIREKELAPESVKFINFARSLERQLAEAKARVPEGRDTVIEECAALVESRAGSGPYAESMGAHRILTSAAEAIRDLKGKSMNDGEEPK